MASSQEKRPTVTPEGLPFPYSHFGDPGERTDLLKKIASTFRLNPSVVLNMGSGYDITPSDAFPNSRVVHVDISIPEYMQGRSVDKVAFLREAGFEAYGHLEMPEGFKADLGINILGPGVDPELLLEEGVLISTETTVPEEMNLIGLVDENLPRNIVSSTEEAYSWLKDINRGIHLVISRKNKEE